MVNMHDTKSLLKKAYASLPNKFNLREIKFYINLAIQKLERLEEKKAYRYVEPPRTVTNNASKETINIINKMIKDEEDKISKNDEQETLLD